MENIILERAGGPRDKIDNVKNVHSVFPTCFAKSLQSADVSRKLENSDDSEELHDSEQAEELSDPPHILGTVFRLGQLGVLHLVVAKLRDFIVDIILRQSQVFGTKIDKYKYISCHKMTVQHCTVDTVSMCVA